MQLNLIKIMRQPLFEATCRSIRAAYKKWNRLRHQSDKKYREGKSEPGSEAPIFATVMTCKNWKDPVPGQKERFYLLYTNHNKEIFFTQTGELKNQLKLLKQMLK